MSAPVVPTAAVSSWRPRVGAVAVGAGLAGAAALVAVNDPSEVGGPFPACVFHAAIGRWCPGCGLTRGTHHLLTGDVGAALGSNLFTPVVLAGIVATWLVWTLRTFGRPVRLPQVRIGWWRGTALVTLVVAFTILRNLPVAPFDALAP